MAQLKSGSTVGSKAIVVTDDSRLSDARTPTSHTHGNITNDGKIGTTTGLMIKTTTGGALTALAQGSAGQFLQHDGTWGTPPDTVYTHPATHPSTMITGLPTSLPANGGNADTVGGFTVGVNVPANAKFTDTVYTHPVNHPPSIISQDTNNRFVTDIEKSTWSGKQDKLTAGTNVTINGNSISATDTKYTAGTNVTINASNVISATDTTYGLATASNNGLMSSAMFTKLNGLYNMVYISESAFTALGTKDPNTLYLRY